MHRGLGVKQAIQIMSVYLDLVVFTSTVVIHLSNSAGVCVLRYESGFSKQA